MPINLHFFTRKLNAEFDDDTLQRLPSPFMEYTYFVNRFTNHHVKED